MKNILCLFAAAALLCGCNNSADKKITRLESQVSNLQEQCDHLKALIDDQHAYSTNAFELACDAIKITKLNSDNDSDIITKVEHYYRATTNIEARLEHQELLERIRSSR
jgi:outer membrane murein-binding lipoprotein Lpp